MICTDTPNAAAGARAKERFSARPCYVFSLKNPCNQRNNSKFAAMENIAEEAINAQPAASGPDSPKTKISAKYKNQNENTDCRKSLMPVTEPEN